jgi:hypothetical protein
MGMLRVAYWWHLREDWPTRDCTIDRIDLAAAQVRQLARKKTDEFFPSNQFCAGT